MWGKHQKWTKELDDQLLSEIAKGKTHIQISLAMKMCNSKISRRIKDMGFENLHDARKVLIG